MLLPKIKAAATINLEVATPDEATKRAALLEMLSNNLEFDVLQILASKSGKAGINKKVRDFQAFL